MLCVLLPAQTMMHTEVADGLRAVGTHSADARAATALLAAAAFRGSPHDMILTLVRPGGRTRVLLACFRHCTGHR